MLFSLHYAKSCSIQKQHFIHLLLLFSLVLFSFFTYFLDLLSSFPPLVHFSHIFSFFLAFFDFSAFTLLFLVHFPINLKTNHPFLSMNILTVHSCLLNYFHLIILILIDFLTLKVALNYHLIKES